MLAYEMLFDLSR